MIPEHPRSPTITAPDSSPLTHQLRSATHDLHRAAEGSGLVRRLLRGEMTRPSYADLLRHLYALYDALERGLDRHADYPGFAAFDFPALRRVPSLAADLQSMGCDPWADLHPVASAFVQRLHELAEHDAPRLIGHAYVRYLGDLNGGQLLSRAVCATPALAAVTTTFYAFETRAVAAARFRSALDALPAGWAAAVVDEACWSFEQHHRLFDQLNA